MHIARSDYIASPNKGGRCNAGIFQVSHLEPLGSGRHIECKRDQGELRAEMGEHGARAGFTDDLIHDVIQSRVATPGERALIGEAGCNVLIEDQRVRETLPAASHINEHI